MKDAHRSRAAAAAARGRCRNTYGVSACRQPRHFVSAVAIGYGAHASGGGHANLDRQSRDGRSFRIQHSSRHAAIVVQQRRHAGATARVVDCDDGLTGTGVEALRNVNRDPVTAGCLDRNSKLAATVRDRSFADRVTRDSDSEARSRCRWGHGLPGEVEGTYKDTAADEAWRRLSSANAARVREVGAGVLRNPCPRAHDTESTASRARRIDDVFGADPEGYAARRGARVHQRVDAALRDATKTIDDRQRHHSCRSHAADSCNAAEKDGIRCPIGFARRRRLRRRQGCPREREKQREECGEQR